MVPIISIIIPTLNEELTIGKTIDSIPINRLKKMGYEIEILVIDGNSTDKTTDIANKKGAKVIIEKRKGYGRAYKTGFLNAKGDIIVTTDADLTYPTEKIDRFIQFLNKKKIDFITTNRFYQYDKNAWNIKNLIGNKLITIITNFLFLMKLKDSQSGMWIFRRKLLKFMKLHEDGMSFSTEIKIEAKKIKCNFVEIPIYYRSRIEGSTSKLNWIKHGFEIINFIIKKRLMTLVGE